MDGIYISTIRGLVDFIRTSALRIFSFGHLIFRSTRDSRLVPTDGSAFRRGYLGKEEL